MLNAHMKALKAISLALIVVLAFVLGHTMGTSQTICQAELINATDTEYQLGFGNQIHTYTFD